jgi:hypothetical protein
MAASNANFWDGHSWNGSEAMIIRSRRFLTRPPSRSRISLLSASGAKTLIVTLQGAQAVYMLTGALLNHSIPPSENSMLALELNLATLFFPLAILGLLRLPAALWLCEDYAYANEDMMQVEDKSCKQKPAFKLDKVPVVSAARRLAPPDDPATIRFHAANGRYGITVRVFYLLLVLTLTGYVVRGLMRRPPPPRAAGRGGRGWGGGFLFSFLLC